MRSVTPGQYLYVVCSAGNDFFPELAAVSIATLRIASPQARITVLTDQETSALDSPAISAIRAEADDYQTINCPGDTAVMRSRYLKCTKRRRVEGPFFYLDCDTIIMKSPNAVWDLDCDIAASPDLGGDGKPYPASAAMPDICEKLGSRLGSQPYLNAGVMYSSGTEGSRAFSRQYLSAWMEFQRKTGKANDQFAFNQAIAAAKPRLAVLPPAYNAQISMNAMALRGAIIVHFFTGTLQTSVETIAHTAARQLRSSGSFDVDALRSAIASGNPWTRIDSYRKAAAAGRYWNMGRLALDRLTKKATPAP